MNVSQLSYIYIMFLKPKLIQRPKIVRSITKEKITTPTER